MPFLCLKPSNGFPSHLEQKPKSNLHNNPQDLTCPGLACLLLLISHPPFPTTCPTSVTLEEVSHSSPSLPGTFLLARGFHLLCPLLLTLPTSLTWFASSLHPYLRSNISSSPGISWSIPSKRKPPTNWSPSPSFFLITLLTMWCQFWLVYCEHVRH